MQNITLTSNTRECNNPNVFLGYEGENNANKLVFEFTDGFVDGLGVLYVKRGEEPAGTVELDKVGETYEFPVKSSILSKVGEIIFQVSVTTSEGKVIKYDKFTMVVKDALDSDIPMPEEYPSWIEMANEKLAEIDGAIAKTETATANAEEVANNILNAKANGEFNGKDGEDGISPTAKVVQTAEGAEVTVMDASGTTTTTIKHGKDGTDGADGISSEISVKTSTETEYVLTIKDKNGSFDTPNLKGKDSEGGIVNETDPVYLADKPKLALKTEIPTKVSELDNDSGYITGYTETDPTVPSHVKGITQANITNWNNKSNFSGNYNDLENKPDIPSIEGLATSKELTQGLATKQDTLVAGNNITIENGVISATGTGEGGLAELPIATTDTLGGIKVGEGLEITEDGILSALGGGSGASQTVLFEGKFLIENGATSETNVLSDSVKNYDYILLTTAEEVPSGDYAGVLARQNTILIDVLSTYTNDDVPSGDVSSLQQWQSNFGNVTGTTYYLALGNFGDGTQLNIAGFSAGTGVNTRNHYVTKVVGIKLGASSGSSYKEVELLSKPVNYALSANAINNINQDLILNGNIGDYDNLIITSCRYSATGAMLYVTGTNLLTSNIIYNNSDERDLTDGSYIPFQLISKEFYVCIGWFKNLNTIRIYLTQTSATDVTGANFRILSIKGIKH